MTYEYNRNKSQSAKAEDLGGAAKPKQDCQKLGKDPEKHHLKNTTPRKKLLP